MSKYFILPNEYCFTNMKKLAKALSFIIIIKNIGIISLE